MRKSLRTCRARGTVFLDVRLLAALLAVLPVGHSVEGRAIRPIVLGPPAAAHRLLVVGCIHGTETAGETVTRRLVAERSLVTGAQIVVVDAVNPDGCAHGTRGNAHGVDLNRNFPSNWARIGRRGDLQWSGPRALSEPESRFVVALVRAVRPDVTVWFHQPQGVIRAWGPSVATARRLGVLAGYPYRSIRWPYGTASNWQNHRSPGTASFVVELPPGGLTSSQVERWARALRRLAREGASR
jgi:protein MpaA